MNGRVARAWTLRLARAQGGNAVVEAALVAPLLVALVAGVNDLSHGISKKLKIQQAATRSIELATASGLNSTAFNSVAVDAAMTAGVSPSQVSLDKWLECSGTRQSSFNGTCASGQNVARYVSIRITSSYKPFFGFLLHYSSMASNGSLPISGYAAVRVQ